MKKLKGFLKPYRRDCVLAPAFKLLEAGMDLLVPLAVAAILDRGVAGGDRAYVVRLFVLLVALAAAGVLFSFTAQWFAARASVGVASDLRRSLFRRILDFSYAQLDALGQDTLITRMTSDVNQVQTGLNLALRLLLRSPFIVFGAVVMAFTIDARCALILAAAVPVLAAVVFGVMLTCLPLYAKVQAALDRLLGITRENLTGARVIRAFRAEEREVAAFDRQSDALTRLSERVRRWSALMNPATYLLINAAAVLLIRQGAVRVQLGTLSQGDVVALYSYMAQILVELIKLASLIITINKSLACARRLSGVLAVEPGLPLSGAAAAPAETDGGAAVRFRGVSFSYEGSGEEAVRDLTFAVPRGRTVGVIGGTGCGKTTLVNLIPRFYDATAGTVEVDGRDVRLYPPGELGRKIGVVPQRAVLFEGTIRGNLLWGDPEAGDDALWRALDLAQARDVVEGKDGGLDAAVEQGGRNFSGGQRQRLCIARALVKRPEILILDDSASALDLATDLRLRRALRGLAGSATVFLVSQRVSTVRTADLILVLDDGRLAGVGTHDELLASCGTYREICASQSAAGLSPETGVTA